jgi:hypothetical protein
MGQGLPWEANSRIFSQKSIEFFGSREFIAMFETAQILFLVWNRWFHSISFPAIYKKFNFKRFRKIAKTTIGYVIFVHLSVSPHGTARLPRNEFSTNFIFKYFSKICQENSSFVESWQNTRIIHMKTNRRFWSYLAGYFWEWEVFHTVLQIKSKLTFYVYNVFRKSCLVWDNVYKPRGAG